MRDELGFYEKKNSVDYIPVINQGLSAKVSVNEVVYIERYNRKVKLVTDEGELLTYEKMKQIVPFLDDRFYACLDGCVINLSKVKKMARCTIHFESGSELRVGRDAYMRTRRAFNEYLRGLKPEED